MLTVERYRHIDERKEFRILEALQQPILQV